MKLRIITHSGQDFNVTVENFDSKEFEDKANDNDLNMIEIGGAIFARIDFKGIIPLDDDSES